MVHKNMHHGKICHDSIIYHGRIKQAEAEVAPSSSLVQVDVEV